MCPCKIAEVERIRQCVRGELELNLVQRMRNLIRSAAASTARDLDQNLGRARSLAPASGPSSARRSTSAPAGSSSSTTSTGPASSGGSKRSYSTSRHSWRFKKSKPACEDTEHSKNCLAFGETKR